jgi:hypothetical protein
MTSDPNEQRFILALGGAVTHVWAELPTEIQEKLFEHAVISGHHTERDESLREQLAKFLHDHHARTRADGDRRRASAPPV